jgi:hypothetical protein
MVSNNLSPADIIQVTLLGAPSGLAIPNINSVALISSELPVWAGAQDYAIYNNPTAVGQDFGTNSLAFGIANAFFAQNPNPIQTQGYLAIIPRLHAQVVAAELTVQDIDYKAVTAGTGGNSITIAYTTGGTAGSELVTVVSNAITVQIASGVSTAQQIVTAVNASGAAAALVVASVFGKAANKQTGPVSATNLIGGSASALEPVHTAMIRTINEVYYFGVLVDFIPATPFFILPSYIAGQDKMLFVATNSKTDFNSGGITAAFGAASQNNVRGLYYNDGVSGDTVNFAAAYAARGLSTDFTGSLTAITMNMKSLVNFVPDTTLNETDLLTALSTGVDLYPPFGFQGLTGVGKLYTSGANGYFDQIYNQYWLKFALQVAGFNYLAGTNYKIPQTEPGMDGLKNAYRQVMAQAVNSGIAAPGAWNSSTVFGSPSTLILSVAAIGYYVYSLPVAQQLASDRSARKAPLVQIAAKMAGAIHTSSVIVQVNL